MGMNSKDWAGIGVKVLSNLNQKSTVEGTVVAASGLALASGQPEAMAAGAVVQGLLWLWKTFFNHNK